VSSPVAQKSYGTATNHKNPKVILFFGMTPTPTPTPALG